MHSLSQQFWVSQIHDCIQMPKSSIPITNYFMFYTIPDYLYCYFFSMYVFYLLITVGMNLWAVHKLHYPLGSNQGTSLQPSFFLTVVHGCENHIHQIKNNGHWWFDVNIGVAQNNQCPIFLWLWDFLHEILWQSQMWFSLINWTIFRKRNTTSVWLS